jgi:hypothetical protein
VGIWVQRDAESDNLATVAVTGSYDNSINLLGIERSPGHRRNFSWMTVRGKKRPILHEFINESRAHKSPETRDILCIVNA